MGDYGTHSKFLKFYVDHTDGDIIEFGVGDYSTGLILDCIKGTERNLVSVESDQSWSERIQSKYPASAHHQYIFVDESKTSWADAIKLMPRFGYSVVFVDQGDWMARSLTIDHFKDHAEYVILHDADYFPKKEIFGTMVSEFEFDFSDIASDWKLYYPEKPFPSTTGPPTLVLSNVGSTVVESHLLEQILSECKLKEKPSL